ncbi:AvrPphF family type III effector [Xylophilus ampelinus]|uniref:AvrPphF family type III effector n=1 Tax=Xylophilus ampelinus TaxID=54067 RepID=UPI000D7C4EF0|nr:AvrPphF family type III effector [Xylophilus ampelinus]MCS4510063.1 AvrPphF family type III effector [Xylophilus ampelinus]
MPAAVRDAFLRENDPVEHLGLTDASRFYRVTDPRWIEPCPQREGVFLAAGNMHSSARIANHLALEKTPLLSILEECASNQPEGPEREEMLEQLRGMQPYMAAEMDASRLPESSLNVMYGTEAKRGALADLNAHGRRAEKRVLMEMTLGDVRKAGGDQVFLTSTLLKQTGILCR